MKSSKKSKEIFNNSHIQDLLKDALKKYSNSQKQIEEAFKRYRPQISKMTEQANIVASRFKDIGKRLDRSGILREISKLKLDNQAKTLMEQLELPAILEKHYFHNITLPPMSPPMTKQPITPTTEKEAMLVSAVKKLSKQVVSMEELVKSRFKEESAIFPEPIIKLPSKTHWEDIKIMFENKYDIAIYRRKKFIKKFSYKELGFACKNKKDKNPDKQWEFLRHLALIYKSKKSMRHTIDNLCYDLGISKDTCLKRKSKLSIHLQNIFGIEEDLFLEYNPDEGYQIRFTIEPDPLLRSNYDLYPSGGKLIDNFDNEYVENNRY